ncbi:J domain-containing protein [Sphingopyxis sp. P1IMeth2]|uniref:J domain-containing protein n=1 Tax=Sphingopyxis sp. P1IMeth2 TaxID=1892848 RepID=UPI001647913B|nr:DnaJ domain-containing protein [Sphingopyxis sp. P1IMeth2]
MKILRVDWRRDAKALETAYRSLAKIYHPDHHETADVVKFNQVIEAYRKPRDAELRAEYDLLHKAHRPWADGVQSASAGLDIDTQAALDDADAQSRILRELYKRRRQNAQDAGVAPFFLQEMLGCSDEHFDFHRWYLKSKGLIETNERGTLAITIDGVDHVITTSRTTAAEQLLIAQTRERKGEPRP